jgi:hypothetical protein
MCSSEVYELTSDGPRPSDLCGLGSGLPGLVTTRPVTPTRTPKPPPINTWTPTPETPTPTPEQTQTPTPHCIFDAQPRSGSDCTSVHVTGRADPPFDTQIGYITVTQIRPGFDFSGGSIWTYLAGGDHDHPYSADFTLNFTAHYASGETMCSGSVGPLYANGYNPTTWCGKLDADTNPGLVIDRPETPQPQYEYTATVTQGWSGTAFDVKAYITPPAAEQNLTEIIVSGLDPATTPNGQASMARDPNNAGHWIVQLCYKGGCAVGSFTIQFDAKVGSTVVNHYDMGLQSAGCGLPSWCSYECRQWCCYSSNCGGGGAAEDVGGAPCQVLR